MDVLAEFPVRKGKRKKQAFRGAVRSYGERLGYVYAEEKGALGVRNVLFGDPEKAEYLVTAHYDTCARLPFPNFITPCNVGIYLLYQIVVALLFCVPVLGAVWLAARLTESPLAVLLTGYGCLILLAWLLLCGPANRHNANDNTSGVILVLELMGTLPTELREKVCFVLFDLEEAGLIGSASYRSRHKKAVRRQLVLNADCIGDGDELLLIPSKTLRKKQPGRLEHWKTLCAGSGEKTVTVWDRGVCLFPSDQANFPLGVGIAAFRRSKRFGLYCARIHTPKDTVCEEKNVTLVRDVLAGIIREQA